MREVTETTIEKQKPVQEKKTPEWIEDFKLSAEELEQVTNQSNEDEMNNDC
jgi:hypothetical protein